MRHFTASLQVKEGNPVFHRPRPVPFAIQKALGEELDRLERGGIIERVETSEWATPIVPVLKKNGQIRLCGDYKVTVDANGLHTTREKVEAI